MVEAALLEAGNAWGMHLSRENKVKLMRAAIEAALDADPDKPLIEFGKRLVTSQTPVEPEFAEALYADRSEMYRTFEPGTIRICPMRDGPCRHGLNCPYVGDGYMGYPCKEGWNGPRVLSEREGQE